MVSLEEARNGWVLYVKAQAGARRNGVMGVHNGSLKVAVSQAPEKGKANNAIAIILADALGLNKNQVELLSGQTSVHKRFLIREIGCEELQAKIAAILGDLESSGK